MSKLLRFRLINICQYDSVDVELGTGMFAVTGPNGCGKTNMLRGLVFGLTGLVDGLWGGKQSLQKDGATTPGYAEAAFSHDGADYVVRRWSVAGMKFQDTVKDAKGDAVATGTKNVDAFMEKVFGMPCRLMFQVCWGRQGELSQTLTGTSAMISSLLSQVFDTKSLETIRQKLKNRIDVIAGISSACKQALEDAKASLAALPADDDLAKAVKAAEERLDKADKAFEEYHAFAMQTSDISAHECRLHDLRKAVEQAEKKVREHAVVKAENPENLTPEQAQARLNEVNAAFNKANLDKVDMAQPKASHEAAIASLEDKLLALLTENNSVREKLDAPAGKCAVCGQPVTDVEAYKRCMCKQLTGYDSPAVYEAACRKSHDEMMARLSAHKAKLATLVKRIAECDGVIARAKPVIDAMMGILTGASYEKAVLELSECRKRLAEEEQSVTLPPDWREEWNRRQTELKAAQAAVEKARAEKVRIETERKLYTKQVADCETAVKQYEINKAARETLVELRDVFSQNRAQARYLRERISMLNDWLQEFVSNTGMPFSVRLDEEQRLFTYKTADGYEHPAAHLSGAQKAMSAVALQMALFQVMEPGMMLYLIDEPTEALDDENKAIMGRMFHRMSMMMPKIGGTMLIVTRDDQIVAGCAATIEAGARR